MSTVRVTAAEAVVRFMTAQRVETPSGPAPLFGGVFAIFGHGIVAGLGEALHRHRKELPTYRAHNEQAMAHAAIGFAKAHFRRRMMAVTSSVGPGATNMVTAAATAHVNRLPLLLLPADAFATRAPDPVLQQVEDFGDGTVTANDCFRPVSRYFDRIMRPEQLITALPRALRVLTDPALCGPVTLAFPQDVQAMAYDFPAELFEPRTVHFRAPQPEEGELQRALEVLRGGKRPLVIAGGGAIYGQASDALRRFAEAFGVPVAETLAGKGALAWDHPLQAGGIGHTGVPAANELASQADVVLAVGTRLGDFTTASHTLFPQARVVGLNVAGFDAAKWWSTPLEADARLGLDALRGRLDGWKPDPAWTEQARKLCAAWKEAVLRITSRRDVALPYDGDVIGAVQRSSERSTTDDIVVTAGGTLPNELQKLYRTSVPGGCHIEYGYSCMGYEIAAGIGVKMAHPGREVIVMLGDGSYLMLNSEIATSVLLDRKIIVVVQDNHGYGCINRLQRHCGGEPFNNMFEDCLQGPKGPPAIDFAMHGRSLGALGENVKTIPELEAALARARRADRTTVICIETDATRTTTEGGAWWEVGIPEISPSEKVQRAREAWAKGKLRQKP
ncbi:MAG TPA: 3D-(3,5/4)-trihydroxycyclohexane-1,2-dione acylhydrolase (decyclizing) [Anaeromyxobacteraceae bacterium]|nr:3D-(3,5/4)-trihydroxycyclohexane-1,2-dione acylhydrolase (decyclizing) [Anaeromyxobacteraceae bacterium]